MVKCVKKTLLVGKAKLPTTLQQVVMDLLQILGRATLLIIVNLEQALTLYSKKARMALRGSQSLKELSLPL